MKQAIAGTHTLSNTRGGNRNPFVPIAFQRRVLLIAYGLIYTILTPALREIVANSSAPLSGMRLATEIAYQVLLFAPIFLYRPRFGWLHPLIFPTVFTIGKRLVKNSGHLLSPLGIGSAPREVLTNPELVGFSEQAMAWATLEHQLLSILSLLCYYGGFFFAQRFTSLDFKPKRLLFSRPQHATLISAGAVLVSAAVALIYVQQHGGLNEYMISYFGQGRSRAQGELTGSVFYLINIGVVGLLMWYALDDEAYKNPAFWAAALYAVPVNFFITGSRSSLFNTVALLLIIWMVRHQKAPKGRALAMGFAAIVLVGVMGNFRSSAWQGRMDWSVFTEITVSQAIEKSNEEINARQGIQGGVPIVARVPEEVGFLKGKSYSAGVFFFVPSFIWEGKPRGGGGLNGEIILGRMEGAGGVPPGAVAEAYWNFWIPGVIGIFFFFGVFHKGLARTFRRYSHAGAVWLLYGLALFELDPTSTAMNSGFKKLTITVVLLLAAGALSWRRRTSS